MWHKAKIRVKFSIFQMVRVALFLALLFVSEIIQKLIPNLPNGLGDISVLMEIMIISGSLILGWYYVFFAVLIYLGFGLFDIPTFFSSLLWVNGFQAKMQVYLLDYFCPLLVLSFAGLFKRKLSWIFISVTFLNIVNYFFHVWSGIIFWGSYSWKGWGSIAYSFAANAIRNSVMLGASWAIIYPAWYVYSRNVLKTNITWHEDKI